MSKHLKIGTQLKAINPCTFDGNDSLIVGKIYTINDFFIEDFVIESEIDGKHFFSVNEKSDSYYKNFFIEITE